MIAFLLAAPVLSAGCLLEGENRAFGDESGRVASLRVNAFEGEHEGEPGGVVEITGVAEEGTYHAFRGEVRVTLERQRPGATQPTYAFVNAWSFDVEEDDFASPTIPKVVHLIPPSDFPEAGTYRVRVAATVGERSLSEASALFDAGGAAAAPTSPERGQVTSGDAMTGSTGAGATIDHVSASGISMAPGAKAAAALAQTKTPGLASAPR